jgi:hypothetical protein
MVVEDLKGLSCREGAAMRWHLSLTFVVPIAAHPDFRSRIVENSELTFVIPTVAYPDFLLRSVSYGRVCGFP